MTQSWNSRRSWGEATIPTQTTQEEKPCWLPACGESVFPFALRLCHVPRGWVGGLVGEELTDSPTPTPCSHMGMEAN